MNKNTDKTVLAQGHYKSDDKLLMRKRFNSFSVPRVKLDEDIIKQVLEWNPKNILDVGCGNGDLLALLRKRGFAGVLTGADISQGMIDAAAAKSKEEHLNITFLVADCERLPFEDTEFDVIIAKHMLYHLPNLQKGIDEICRCLKKGGKFLITLNSQRNTPQFHEIEEKVRKRWNLEGLHGQDIVNMETISPALKSFNILSSVCSEGFIDKPELFPDYFASFRDFFEPYPDDKLWTEILQEVNDFVKHKIASEGRFVEKRVTGIIVAEKK